MLMHECCSRYIIYNKMTCVKARIFTYQHIINFYSELPLILIYIIIQSRSVIEAQPLQKNLAPPQTKSQVPEKQLCWPLSLKQY